jgi:hypothetical protein
MVPPGLPLRRFASSLLTPLSLGCIVPALGAHPKISVSIKLERKEKTDENFDANLYSG